MKNLSLRFKLFLVLTILSFVAIVVALTGLTKLSDMNDRLNNVIESTAKKVELASAINQDLLRISRAEKNIILADTQELMDDYAKEIEAVRTQMQEKRTNLRNLVDEEGKKKLDLFAESWDKWFEIDKQVRQYARLNSNVKAKNMSGKEGREAFDKAEQALRELLQLTTGNNQLLVAQALADALSVHRAEKNIILETTEEGMDKYASALESFQGNLNKKIDTVATKANSNELALIGIFKERWQEFMAIDKKVRETTRENGNSKAFFLSIGDGRKQLDITEKYLNEIIDKNIAEMARDKITSDENYASARLMMLLVSIIGISLALLLGFIVVQGVVKVLKSVFGGLKGCSTEELEHASQTLNQIITSLSDGSYQVSSASNQVSTASQSLAEGANEQAASLEETSSSLEEMASMTTQNNNNAQEVNSLMSKAAEMIASCKDSMDKLAKAIEEIKNSSDETSKIVKTIDEIAFQTNLLALNAAVEAARAGEAGRGFAVVADEVGNLAQRAGEAARNTGALIEQSVKKSEKGFEVAQETEKALDSVIASSQKVSDLISEIAASCNEQSQGIQQINQAVSQLDTVTQQNSSAAEESAAAAEELNAQADQLLSLVRNLEDLVGKNNSNANDRVHSIKATKSRENVVLLKKANNSKFKKKAPLKTTNVVDEEAEELIPLNTNSDRDVVGF